MDVESFISLLGVDFKKEGALYKICCPFHHDTHPSLVVYPQDRGYCCYPCARTGSWQELYKEIKGCEWKEAYDVLEIDGDYHAEKKPTIRFEFVDKEDDKFASAIRERYEKCLALDAPEAKPAVEFLNKKHLLEPAKELGWRWDTGVFVQSKPRGALVMPYREDGEVVSCRLRTLEEDGSISKPKTLKGTHARPYVLTRDGSDILYICEGETDALSLYTSGCSVVAVPGAGQKRCINTAVLYAELTDAKKIIACGDNDGPGQMMNDLAQKAAHALTICQFDTLRPEDIGGMNDINDAFVAGKLNLGDVDLRSILAGATEVTGWEALYAKALFSTKEEIWAMVADTCGKAFEDESKYSEEEFNFVSDLYADSLEELKAAWVKGTVPLQLKYVYLKETLKLAFAPEKPLHQQSMFKNDKYGA